MLKILTTPSILTLTLIPFRLLFSQAAYILLLAIRQAAQGTQFATAQVPRLQAMLIKSAARVRVSAQRVLVELAAYCPFAQEQRQITQRLVSSNRNRISFTGYPNFVELLTRNLIAWNSESML
jgi:hypothetical protein